MKKMLKRVAIMSLSALCLSTVSPVALLLGQETTVHAFSYTYGPWHYSGEQYGHTGYDSWTIGGIAGALAAVTDAPIAIFLAAAGWLAQQPKDYIYYSTSSRQRSVTRSDGEFYYEVEFTYTVYSDSSYSTVISSRTRRSRSIAPLNVRKPNLVPVLE